MERNYVTVTLCVVGDNDILDRCARDLPLPRQATREAAWLPRLAACQKSFFCADEEWRSRRSHESQLSSGANRVGAVFKDDRRRA